jgi:hypothetical protein
MAFNRMTNEFFDLRSEMVVETIKVRPNKPAHRQWEYFWRDFENRHEEVVSLIQNNKL